jgi:biotin transport system substrate-specific component
MMLGHAIILALGWGWLAFGIHLGASKAWLVGVVPFSAGAIVKSILGAVLMPAIRKLVDNRA